MNTDNKEINQKSSLYKIVSGIYRQKDVDELRSYMKTDEGEAEFNELSYSIWEEIKGMNEIPEVDPNEVNLILRKQNSQKKKRMMYVYSGAVAVVLMLLAVGVHFYMKQGYDVNQEMRLVASQMTHTTDAKEIQLILQDKRIEVAGEAAKVEYKADGQVKVNESVVYEEKVVENKEQMQYNQLIVPKGKRSILELSDGTVLWVNSGTTVIYPMEFAKSKREIFVDGEVFLDVHSDKKSPFFVRTKNMDVKVTGTRFNVTAYEKDDVMSVVLVSGSVQVKTENGKSNLTPNNRLTCENGNLSIQNVDVMDYVTWKDGFYQFKSEKLGEILKRLSRYYGIKIDVSESAAQLVCNGRLDLKDDLSRVLDGLKVTAPILVKQRENQYIITLNSDAYDIVHEK